LFTFFILICRFSYVNAFHAHVTAGAKALSGNVVVSTSLLDSYRGT